MNVSLAPELEELISEKVQSGRYTSASEVVSREHLMPLQIVVILHGARDVPSILEKRCGPVLPHPNLLK